MALMLCRLQKTTSESMSSRVIARPRFASNSWRSAPLNTMRLPLSVIMPFSMRNVRKPIFCVTVSMMAPSCPTTRTVSVYSVGDSALHGAMFVILPELRAISPLQACVDSHTTFPSPSRSVLSIVIASAGLRKVSAALSSAVSAVPAVSAAV